MSGVMPPIPSPEVSQLVPVEASLAVGADWSFSLKAIHRTRKRSWNEQITYERCTLQMDSDCFGERNGFCCGSTSDFVWSYGICFRGGLSETIHDALGNKALSTLHSRAGSFLRYINPESADRGMESLRLY